MYCEKFPLVVRFAMSCTQIHVRSAVRTASADLGVVRLHLALDGGRCWPLSKVILDTFQNHRMAPAEDAEFNEGVAWRHHRRRKTFCPYLSTLAVVRRSQPTIN
jgi:hypothetical protein